MHIFKNPIVNEEKGTVQIFEPGGNNSTILLLNYDDEGFVEKNGMVLEANIYDLISSDWFESASNDGDENYWPYSIAVYSYKNETGEYYIISDDKIEYRDYSEGFDYITYINGNKFQLLSFIKEFCLPFIKQ